MFCAKLMFVQIYGMEQYILKHLSNFEFYWDKVAVAAMGRWESSGDDERELTHIGC